VTNTHPSVRQKVHLAQRRKARKLIMQALYQWHMTGDDVAVIEAQFRAEYSGKTDWDYFHEVFSEIPRQHEELDAQYEPFLDRQLKSLDPVEKALLRLGTFELAKRIDVPYKVVINECVNLAKQFGASESHKYINGILDKLARDLRSLEAS
jgi:N utilization substance protein B